jgi:hypothetical protein
MDKAQEALLELALELAERGIPVFPCAANKAPVIPKDKGGNGFHDASTDIDVIERLFRCGIQADWHQPGISPASRPRRRSAAQGHLRPASPVPKRVTQTLHGGHR